LDGSVVIQFTLNGARYELTAEDVRRRLRDASPEPIQQYGIRVGSSAYPVKQAFEAATGIPRSAFTTQPARRHLAALGFELVSNAHQRPAAVMPEPRVRRSDLQAPGEPGPSSSTADWHTEAQVQAMLVEYLVHDGWQIVSQADTARRERGIDIVAARKADTVAIEVKGFPGRGYADPRRKGERKRAQPSTQAKGWYGRAVLAAMLTRTRMPQARSVIALPDFPRYRDLFRETAEWLQRCSIELWWVSKDGDVMRDNPRHGRFKIGLVSGVAVPV
jgi:Holliday junction resolvase-like predicted endonuclease